MPTGFAGLSLSDGVPFQVVGRPPHEMGHLPAGQRFRFVDRPGWAADNAIVPIFSTDSCASKDRKLWSYDGDREKAAGLVITYQPR